MISVSGKKWEQKKINQNLVDKLKQDFNFSDILSRLIISRKFEDDEIASIDTDLDLDLHNVFLNNEDFNQSIKLVVNCINNNEKICILGDYDVDGSAATSLFVKFLESINHPFFYYIPDREKDGYGATKKLFQKLILDKPKLIIMVDCGSTSNEAIDFLNEKCQAISVQFLNSDVGIDNRTGSNLTISYGNACKTVRKCNICTRNSVSCVVNL